MAAVEQRDISVYRDWIGTLDGQVNAAICSQGTGYLLNGDYSEGSLAAKSGQLLFQIDPRPLQASGVSTAVARGQLAQANGQLAQAQAQYQQSEAQLASAEANQRKAQFDEDRYTPLAKEKAVTQQDLDGRFATYFGQSPGEGGDRNSRKRPRHKFRPRRRPSKPRRRRSRQRWSNFVVTKLVLAHRGHCRYGADPDRQSG